MSSWGRCTVSRAYCNVPHKRIKATLNTYRLIPVEDVIITQPFRQKVCQNTNVSSTLDKKAAGKTQLTREKSEDTWHEK